MIRVRIIWLLCLLVAFATESAFAQTSTSAAALELDEIGELDLEALLGTVFAASRTEESRLRAPAAVTILDRERIQLAGARSIPELLRQVPGVHVMATIQGSWVVSLRGSGGLQGNNVVVLLDGHPINSILDGGVDWTTIPIDIREIERIEIVRGPVSTIYGANAYTGVVAIVTDARGEGASALSGALRAGYGDGVTGAVYGALRGDLGGARYKASATASLRPEAQGNDRAPELQRVAGHIHVERTLGESVRGEVTVAATHAGRGVLDHLVIAPQELDSNVGLADLMLELTEISSLVDSIQLWSRGTWLSTRGNQTQTQSFSYAGVAALAGTLGVDVHLRVVDELSLQFGADAGGVQVDSPFLHPDENDRFRQSYGFHASASSSLLDALALSLGVRGDLSAMTRDPQFSFRSSATYFSSDFSLRLSAGTAYRQPTVIEVGSRLVDPQTGLILLEGSPELSVPRLDSLEFGAILGLGSDVTLTPTLFIERLRSLMVTDFEALVRKTFRSDDGSRVIAGGELELEWRIMDNLTGYSAIAMLRQLSGATPVGATVGVEENNPMLTASGGIRGRVLDERVGFGLDVAFVSERSFNVRTGIPPRLISSELSPFVQLAAAVEYKVLDDQPLWGSIKIDTRLPHDHESPYVGVLRRTTEALVSLEWRTN